VIYASIFSDFWHDQIAAEGRQAIFLLLLAFLGSFLFIRTSARLGRSTTWWPGSVVTDDGLHLHHLVWGIFTMMISGVIAFSLKEDNGWFLVCAALFGIGMGLTIDEFALWVYLKDVYWADEGRASVDAALYATAIIALILIGIDPFEGDNGAWGAITTAAFNLFFSLLAFSKQRITHGLLGLFIPIFSIYAVCRLAKPNSPWARKFYGDRRPEKQARAVERYSNRRIDREKARLRDALGGKPTAELEIEGKTPKRVSGEND
jgi:hypothetical protein